ncbi:MAG: hypothetical protein M1831_003786 [Alyxoria varia]|nr:MAG: hypothetical protein M1831_003786 [Alyxoria varia]
MIRLQPSEIALTRREIDEFLTKSKQRVEARKASKLQPRPIIRYAPGRSRNDALVEPSTKIQRVRASVASSENDSSNYSSHGGSHKLGETLSSFDELDTQGLPDYHLASTVLQNDQNLRQLSCMFDSQLTLFESNNSSDDLLYSTCVTRDGSASTGEIYGNGGGEEQRPRSVSDPEEFGVRSLAEALPRIEERAQTANSRSARQTTSSRDTVVHNEHLSDDSLDRYISLPHITRNNLFASRESYRPSTSQEGSNDTTAAETVTRGSASPLDRIQFQHDIPPHREVQAHHTSTAHAESSGHIQTPTTVVRSRSIRFPSFEEASSSAAEVPYLSPARLRRPGELQTLHASPPRPSSPTSTTTTITTLRRSNATRSRSRPNLGSRLQPPSRSNLRRSNTQGSNGSSDFAIARGGRPSSNSATSNVGSTPRRSHASTRSSAEQENAEPNLEERFGEDRRRIREQMGLDGDHAVMERTPPRVGRLARYFQ